MSDVSEGEYKPFYSLAYLSVFGCSPVEQIRIASETGYEAVGLRLRANEDAGDKLSLSSKDCSLILSTLQETKMQVSDVELFTINDDFYKKDFEFYLEQAAALGATRLISSVWLKEICSLSFIIEAFAKLCQKAAEYNLIVVLEFPTFSRLNTLKTCLEVLEKTKQSNSELLLDTLYVHLNGITREKLFELETRWVKFLHICDVPFGLRREDDNVKDIARHKRLYPGEGCVDFEKIIGSLPTPKYYALEIPHEERCQLLGYRQHAKNCLKAAKDTLESLLSKREYIS